MENRKKAFIFGLVLLLLVIIGLVIVVAIVVGLFLANRPQPVFSIEITSTIPSGQTFRNGYIILQLALPTGIKIQGSVRVYLDGVEQFSYKSFPTNLQISTFGLEDGNHTVSIVVLSQDNGRGYGEIIVLVEDPRIGVLGIEYQQEIFPGILFMITVEIAGPASHMVANYSSLFGYSVISTSNIQKDDHLTNTLSIPISFVTEEQFHSISLVIYNTDGRTLKVPGIEVFFQFGATNPFTIDEGIVDMRSFPLTAPTDNALTLTLPPSFEVSISTGQSVEIPIVVSQSAGVSEVLVGFEGYGQHFIIPITSLQNTNSRRSIRQTNPESQTLAFMLMLPIGSIVNGSQITMLIRLRDNVGELGPIQMITTTTSLLNIGTLHVRLTWDREVDLDLHVVDPNNEEIYYGNKESSGQQGTLDLDSNPNCTIDHIRTENVYYENAVSGQYVIRVDLFAACNVTEQINFQVWVDGCNISQTLNGMFLPSEEDSGEQGSGKLISMFVVECDKYLVGGTISYRTPTARMNPLGSIVRVVDSQGSVLGTSQVVRDANDSMSGAYYVAYSTEDGYSPVYVEFLSSNNKIQVTDHVGNIHVYRVSESITPNLESNATRNSIIREVDSSGAFNIMVTLTRMLPLYLAYGGVVTDYPRIADWEYGKYAKDTDYATSYFYEGTISIGGNPMDPDEFDNSVLLHEFGHLILDRTGAVITGSGYHDSSPISPDFAFSEGYSTYLGQKVLGNLIYCDGFCYDLSNLQGLYLGTTSPSDGSSGDISEDVVASAAYKLDFNIGLGTLMAQSLTDPNKLLKESNYDRLGSVFAVDFADMVSIVVCPLNSTTKSLSADLLNEYYLPWIIEFGFCI